jgi:hypothetical protein
MLDSYEAPLPSEGVTRRWWVLLLPVLIGAAVLILFQRDRLVAWGRFVDDEWAGQHLRDVVGRLYWHEDWDGVPSAAAYDYRWIPEMGELWIAHALGASETPEQNSLRAYDNAKAKGFHFFEVDLWLTKDGQVRCHHGPGEPVASLRNMVPRDDMECEIGTLLDRIAPDDYLVLDIKTDFQATGAAVLRVAKKKRSTGRLIFQLYQPSDFAHFAQWLSEYTLPGPIVTTYRAHLPIWRELPPLQVKGYRAVTIPLDSVDHLPTNRDSVFLLSHPVHDCATLSWLRNRAIHGFYSISALQC